ncbi:MAG TPA: RsmE family RNA methyltransferase [Gemmatimonadales bacterium]|nr:RsmE family RNA methyltransferase [Gemmatimonadales bacterium]
MIVLVTRGGRSGTFALADGEEHHLRVRRAEDGELVDLRDGFGLVGIGRLQRQGRGWTVEVETAREVSAPAPLTLGVGAGDRERFEWLVEKAAELGVTAIVPLETERAVGVGSRLRTGQADKLRRRALEAVKQCGAAWAPAIENPAPLATFLARPVSGTRWLADPEGSAPRAVGSDELTIVVGPEGGLTAAEREAVLAAGYQPVALCENILRFETAAVAAAAVAAAARSGEPGGLHA